VRNVLALFVFGIATSISFAPREAQAAANEHGIGLGFGQILLMGDYAKSFSDNIGLDVFYSYETSNLFGLLANVSLSSHSNADNSNTLSIKGITPDLRINLAYIDKLVIYSFVGFGVFMVNEKIGPVTGSATTLGFNMGAAFDLALAKHFQFGTQLGFTNVFGKTDPSTVTATSPQGLSVGGTYLGILLNLIYIF
jgi:hypothetical protein